MLRILLSILICCYHLGITIQAEEDVTPCEIPIPSHIEIANTKIQITSAAKKKIRIKMRNTFPTKKSLEKFFVVAATYFPIIKKYLKEGKVPEDLKYLMLLESAGIGNARSSSNAVGYWQFKEPAARGVGLTINNSVDERMHIQASTIGFVKQVNRNNRVLHSWMFTVMSFYTGLGGTQKIIKEKKLHPYTITNKWHFYIHMFIAYKLVLGKYLKKIHKYRVRLGIVNCNGKNVSEICKKYKVSKKTFYTYNHWLLVKRVPKKCHTKIILPIKKR